MNKSILVMDTPDSCFSCPLCIDETCIVLEKTVITGEDFSERSEECTLKALPQKQVCNEYNFETYVNGVAQGHNNIIDYLTGEGYTPPEYKD